MLSILSLIINLQSGNMTDEPGYLVARNQLMLPADPVRVIVLICVAILIHPVAEVDR
jgi:hypothetical protein